MKKPAKILLAFVALAPIVYLFIVFPHLPDTVPTHFDMNGKPNGWDSKNTFLIIIIGMSALAFFINFLLPKAYLIDPKKNAIENKGRLQKIGLAISVFIASIEFYIIHIVESGSTKSSPRLIFVGVGILLAIIGNYLDNIKPNYFAGLRLPWTLESEDNWRKTHHYASKIWFIGGLVIAACSLLLPFSITIVVLFLSTLIMVLLPSIYSYQLYRRNKQNFNG